MGISRRLSCAKAHDIIMSGANYISARMRMGISRRLSCAEAHDIIMSGANYIGEKYEV